MRRSRSAPATCTASGTPETTSSSGKGYVRPPDNLAYFLTQIFESMRKRGGKRPGLFDVAYLLTRYRTEFGMAVPPRRVQRVLFPIVVTVGRLFGRHRRFAAAPEPISR